MLIATHDGTFHADETVACAILSYIFDNTSVIRTRNPLELEKADLLLMCQVKTITVTLIIIPKNLP